MGGRLAAARRALKATPVGQPRGRTALEQSFNRTAGVSVSGDPNGTAG